MTGGEVMSFLYETSNWDNYLKYGERQFYKAKTTIYHEKEDGVNGFYFLKKGRIRISTSNYNNGERILDIASSKITFGEQAGDGEKYFSTAIAIEDSIIYFFPSDIIENLMTGDNQFRILIYLNLTEKLKVLSNNVVFDSLPSAQLLARTILNLKEKYAATSIPFNQKELCRYTNLNRVTVYKVLKEWDETIITMQNKNIIIKNTQALEEIAAI